MMRRKDPTEWRKKVAAWKNGTPTSELFNIPKYDDGTDGNNYDTENPLDTKKQIDWMRNWLNARRDVLEKNADAVGYGYSKYTPKNTTGDVRNAGWNVKYYDNPWNPFAYFNDSTPTRNRINKIIYSQIENAQSVPKTSVGAGVSDDYNMRGVYVEPDYWNNGGNYVAFAGIPDQGVIVHELTHASHPEQQERYILNNIFGRRVPQVVPLRRNTDLQNAKELYGALQQFRYENKLNPKYKVTQEWINKNKDLFKGTYLEKIKDSDKLKLFNDVAQNNINTKRLYYADKGKSIKQLRKYDTGWWDNLKDKIPGYVVKAARFVAPTTFNTIATIIGKTSEALHNRNRLLRAAHSSSRGGDTNVESFILDSNPKDDLVYTGSFKLPLDQKGGTVFKADPNSSEKSRYRANKERDLVKYAITGENGSITEAEPITVNGHTYDRTIDGVIFPYSSITFPKQLQNVVDSIASSPKPIMSLGPNTGYGDGDGTFSYIDNVANHSGVFKKTKKGFEFVPFDYWDFAGNYKYVEKLPKVNELFESLIQPNEKYPNSGPFAIRQKGIPIVFDDSEDINFLNWYSTLKRGSDTNSATQSMINAIREYKGYDKGKSIHINPANKGKFNATKKRTGKTTEQLAHSKNPLTRKRAVFALNSRKFKH